MLISVIVPFRPDLISIRTQNMHLIKSYYEEFFNLNPQWDWEWIICDDPDPDTFNRGRALNEGVRRSRGDYLILADADLAVAISALSVAVEHTIRTGEPVVPFRTVAYLPPGFAEKLGKLHPSVWNYADRSCHPEGTEYAEGFFTGGINVLPRTVFREAGGFDPRFHGWGAEDCAFGRVLKALGKPFVYVEGTALHLWHHKAANEHDVTYQASQAYFAATYINVTDHHVLALKETFPQYGIAAGYTHRPHVPHFDDTGNTDKFQQEVYEKAVEVGHKFGLDRVADLGCGSGFKAVHTLYRAFEEVVGYEVEPTLSWLRNKYPHHTWKDAQQIEEITAQLVVCADVIEHVADPDQFMNRLLQSEAETFVISTPCRTQLGKIRNRKENGPPWNHCHHREWTVEEFSAYIGQWLHVHEAYVSNPREATALVVAWRKG